MDKDYAKLRENADALKALAQNDRFICKAETLNNPLAYLGAVPGNYALNAKKFTVSTRNLAHFFPLSSPWEGNPCDEHLRALYRDKYDMEITAPFLNACQLRAAAV
jgi:type IV secretory pathway VirB4 component